MIILYQLLAAMVIISPLSSRFAVTPCVISTIAKHISHLATVEIRVVRLGSFQNLYLSFAIVEITHGVTANRDDTDFHHAKPQIL